jgi:hypothetical protein
MDSGHAGDGKAEVEAIENEADQFAGSRLTPDANPSGGANSGEEATVREPPETALAPKPDSLADLPEPPPDSIPSSGTAPGPGADAAEDLTTTMDVALTDEPKAVGSEPEPTPSAEAVSSGSLSPKLGSGHVEATNEQIPDEKPDGRQLPPTITTPPTASASQAGPMTESRYSALFSQEEQIRMLRRAYLYNRSAQSSKKQPTKRLPPIASLQGRHSLYLRGVKRHKGPGEGHGRFHHDDSDYQKWINEMIEARQKVNQWVFHYRVARQDYWRRRKLAQRQKPKGPAVPPSHRALLMAAPLSKYRTFGAIEGEEEDSAPHSGTALLGTSQGDGPGDICQPCATSPAQSCSARDPGMQCLDCLFTGTFGDGSFQNTEEHMVTHFLSTNHNFGECFGGFAAQPGSEASHSLTRCFLPSGYSWKSGANLLLPVRGLCGS